MLHTSTPSFARDVKVAEALKRENPALTWYKVKSASYKFAFLLVPLSLPFMWLMFIGAIFFIALY